MIDPSASALASDGMNMLDLATLRGLIRRGIWTGHTCGVGLDHVQVNVVLLPVSFAASFRAFCALNPRACPLLAESPPGAPHLPSLGAEIDVRCDVPRYRVFRNGQLIAEPTDIRALYRDDLVTFALGCSFSFEQALMRAGILLRHVSMRRNVAMYRTDRACVQAGPFRGPLVVSMRPIRRVQVTLAEQITARFPSVHGAPVHVGEPRALGIGDLSRPDFGDPVAVLPGERPMFWACGVTAEVALAAARPPLAITHAPGAMLITDLVNERLASGEAADHAFKGA